MGLNRILEGIGNGNVIWFHRIHRRGIGIGIRIVNVNNIINLIKLSDEYGYIII